jgi:hypothetical protein
MKAMNTMKYESDGHYQVSYSMELLKNDDSTSISERNDRFNIGKDLHTGKSLPNTSKHGKLIRGMLDPTWAMIYVSFHTIPSYPLNIIRKTPSED